MNALLYQVGRNLNRAYRTAEAFGIEKLLLFRCPGEIRGNLYGAKGRVQVVRLRELPLPRGLLALETNYDTTLDAVDWKMVDTILVGGESKGLPHWIAADQKARIPMFGKVSGLTVEATLAIALHTWRNRISHSQVGWYDAVDSL